MNLRTFKQNSRVIVYDTELTEEPAVDHFEPEYWRRQNGVLAEAKGRGTVWIIDAPFGPSVLRRYRRGGWAAKMTADRYLFFGWSRTRPVREMQLTAALHERGLPVPRPVSALAERRGFTYRAALITREIAGASPLSVRLPQISSSEPRHEDIWAAIGRTIRRFHDAGLLHPDLNASNILIQEGGEVFLIDFDRARLLDHSSGREKSSLNRLHRSLIKLWPPERADTLPDCWERLQIAYEGAGQ